MECRQESMVSCHGVSIVSLRAQPYCLKPGPHPCALGNVSSRASGVTAAARHGPVTAPSARSPKPI